VNKEENYKAIESARASACAAYEAARKPACDVLEAAREALDAARAAHDAAQDAYDASVVSTYDFYEAFILVREALEAASKEGSAN